MIRPFWEEAGLPVAEVEAKRGVKYLEDSLTLMEGRGRTAEAHTSSERC